MRAQDLDPTLAGIAEEIEPEGFTPIPIRPALAALWAWLERPDDERSESLRLTYDALPRHYAPILPIGLRDLFAQARWQGLSTPSLPSVYIHGGTEAGQGVRERTDYPPFLDKDLQTGAPFSRLRRFGRAWVDELAWEGVRGCPHRPNIGGRLPPRAVAQNAAYLSLEIQPRRRKFELQLRGLVTNREIKWALRERSS